MFNIYRMLCLALNGQNHSLPDSHNPIKNTPSKISHTPYPFMQFGKAWVYLQFPHLLIPSPNFYPTSPHQRFISLPNNIFTSQPNKNFIFSCSHCSCTNLILTLYSSCTTFILTLNSFNSKYR